MLWTLDIYDCQKLPSAPPRNRYNKVRETNLTFILVIEDDVRQIEVKCYCT